MFSIFKLLKNYKKEAILGPLFKLIEAAFELMIPLVISFLVDKGINGDSKNIIIASVLLVVFPLLGLVFSITAQYFSAYAAVNVASELRHDLFTKIQSLSYSEFDTLGTSSLITRMTSDVNQVQTGVNLTLRLLLRSPIVVFGASIMALTISLHEGLVFLGVTTLLFLSVYIIMKITMPLYVKNQSKLDDLLKKTRENFSGIRVIRAFNHEDEEVEAYQKSNNDYTVSQLHVSRISALLNPITYVLVNASIILLIYIGAIKVENGDLTQGQVIALYNYMSLVLVELLKFANLLVTMNKSIASSKRINNILAKNSSLESTQNEDINTNKHVVFDNVTFTYAGAANPSLKDISFDVNKGEKVGIIGPTGSGKSTLVNLIGHFYNLTSGNIYVDAKDVSSYDNDILRNKIGTVFQKPTLFKGTIKENLLWGNANATNEDINKALIASQSLEVVNSKDNGIDSEVLQNGKNFSGGQKQRLSLARALVRKPEILILDDTTSALDYATEAKVIKELYSLEYNPTIFMISQRTSSIKNADKIIVLEDGVMVGYGTHEELLNSCKLYKEIHESQTKKEDN